MTMMGISFLVQAANQARKQLAIQRHQQGITARIGRSLMPAALAPDIERVAVRIERAFAGGPPRSDMTCPQCAGAMVAPTIDGVTIDCCLDCRGAWFDEGEIQVFTRFAEEVPGRRKRDRDSRYACPHCGQAMRECQFLPPHNLLVDVCPKRCGTWFEDGELRRALTLVTR